MRTSIPQNLSPRQIAGLADHQKIALEIRGVPAVGELIVERATCSGYNVRLVPVLDITITDPANPTGRKIVQSIYLSDEHLSRIVETGDPDVPLALQENLSPASMAHLC
jgi:hypothetical protein